MMGAATIRQCEKEDRRLRACVPGCLGSERMDGRMGGLLQAPKVGRRVRWPLTHPRNEREQIMRITLILASLTLSGCALGASRLDEYWAKEGASDKERDAVVAVCTARMRALPPVYDPSFRAVSLIPGHSLIDIADDRAARNQFSINCMQAEGYRLVRK